MNYYNNYGFQQPNYNYNYTNFAQLNYVGSLEEAKAYIMQPNQVIYFLDSNSKMLYEKRSDNQCKTTLFQYNLVESENKEIDFKTVINEINNKIDKLSQRLETSFKTHEKGVNENE